MKNIQREFRTETLIINHGLKGFSLGTIARWDIFQQADIISMFRHIMIIRMLATKQ